MPKSYVVATNTVRNHPPLPITSIKTGVRLVPSEKLKDIKCEMTVLDSKMVYKDDHTLITTESKKKRP
jgi:hypothetical protein